MATKAELRHRAESWELECRRLKETVTVLHEQVASLEGSLEAAQGERDMQARRVNELEARGEPGRVLAELEKRTRERDDARKHLHAALTERDEALIRVGRIRDELTRVQGTIAWNESQVLGGAWRLERDELVRDRDAWRKRHADVTADRDLAIRQGDEAKAKLAEADPLNQIPRLRRERDEACRREDMLREELAAAMKTAAPATDRERKLELRAVAAERLQRDAHVRMIEAQKGEQSRDVVMRERDGLQALADDLRKRLAVAEEELVTLRAARRRDLGPDGGK